jgi:hypothetical protein
MRSTQCTRREVAVLLRVEHYGHSYCEDGVGDVVRKGGCLRSEDQRSGKFVPPLRLNCWNERIPGVSRSGSSPHCRGLYHQIKLDLDVWNSSRWGGGMEKAVTIVLIREAM